MYKIDMSNKHKKNYVAFVTLVGGESIMVFTDTITKFIGWLCNSTGIKSYELYDKRCNSVLTD